MELREVCAGLLGSSELVRFNRADPEIGRGYAGKVELCEVFEHHGRLNLNHIRLAQKDDYSIGNDLAPNGVLGRRRFEIETYRALGNAIFGATRPAMLNTMGQSR